MLLGLRNAWFEQYIRDMDFRWEALVETLTKVVSFAVVLSISIATGSYWALPLSLIASGVAAVVLSYVLCPRLPGFCLSEFRKFFGFSVWLGLGQIADSVRDTAGTFLIGKFVGTTRLGAWSVGTQFADRLELVLYSPMERTLFAAFSSIRHDAEHLRETFLKAMHTGFASLRRFAWGWDCCRLKSSPSPSARNGLWLRRCLASSRLRWRCTCWQGLAHRWRRRSAIRGTCSG